MSAPAHEVDAMFHDIPAEIERRMRYLEALEIAHREDTTLSPDARLHAIPPETGRFLALMLALAPEGVVLELGTSGGYSTLWLALACRVTKRRLETFECMEEKARLARETFASARVESLVELHVGDAKTLVGGVRDVGFCFLDIGPAQYQACYELVVPNLVRGGVLVADNVLRMQDNVAQHEAAMPGFIAAVTADRRVDATIVPIGKGLMLCRKL